SASTADIVGNGLPQFEQASGGAVMRPSSMKSVNTGRDHVRWSVKIGLANFKVNDFFALFFERPRAVENFKSGFGTEPRHPAGETQFVLSCSRHSVGIVAARIIAPWTMRIPRVAVGIAFDFFAAGITEVRAVQRTSIPRSCFLRSAPGAGDRRST